MTPSTPLLSEAARHLVYPRDSIRRSLWPQVRQRLEGVGVEFDPWQEGLSTIALGVDGEGLFAASVGGVVVSIPRQVGKTFTIGHLLIGMCLEFPGLEVVWTSHHATTTDNTFQSMQALVLRPEVKPFLAGKPRTANGQQRIVFANRSRIRFGAREHGFGRGLDAIDVLMLDEAQKLSVKALEDMVPSTNQARNPHGGLVFFAGTPPRPVDDGEAFTSLRRAALAGESPSRVYVEFSADPDAAWDDREQWRRMNPSFPHRTPEVSMLRMRELIPGDDSWRREAMGIWDELDAAVDPAVIPDRLWADLATDDPPMDGTVAYAVRFSADGATVAVAVALRPDGGPIHVEGVGHHLVIDGVQPIVDWLQPRASEAARIVVDGKAGAGAFVRALRAAGVPERKVLTPTTDQAITAHSMLLDAARSGGVSHLDDPVLAASVDAAARRAIGKAGGWGFQSRNGGDVTLAEAVAFAHFGAATAPRRAAGRPQGRRAVVLS